MTAEEIERIEDLANGEVLSNERVRVYETTKAEAEAMGAIAFFGDKYGDVVRVLEAGRNSLELCGGTHVHALGDIGTIKVVSEGSIGSNLRRIEAVTGMASVELLQRDERALDRRGRVCWPPRRPRWWKASAGSWTRSRRCRTRSGRCGPRPPAGRAAELAAGGGGRDRGRPRGRPAARGPARPGDRGARASRASTPSCSAAAATRAARRWSLRSRPAATARRPTCCRDAAKAVKGGGGGKGDIAVAGGKDPAGVDEALDIARRAALARPGDG